MTSEQGRKRKEKADRYAPFWGSTMALRAFARGGMAAVLRGAKPSVANKTAQESMSVFVNVVRLYFGNLLKSLRERVILIYVFCGVLFLKE